MFRLSREVLGIFALFAFLFTSGCREGAEPAAVPAESKGDTQLKQKEGGDKSAALGVASKSGSVMDKDKTPEKAKVVAKAKKRAPITMKGELEQAYVAVHHGQHTQAQRLFRMACKLGSVLGCVEAAHSAFHRRDVENKALAMADLVRSGGCTEKLGSSCVLMGDLMRSNWMLKADHEGAKKYYEVACDGREPGSCVKLAQLFDELDPERASKLRARRVWREGKDANLPSLVRDRNVFLESACADREHHVSCLLLGDFYADNAPPWADHPKAAELYRKACAANLFKGCFSLGEVLRLGKLETDMQSAAQAYEKGCSGGHGSSCLQLAWMFKREDLKASDPHRVESLLKMADQFQAHKDKELGRSGRVQSLNQAFSVLESARASWKPEGVYCVHRRWDFKFAGYSERSMSEVDGYRLLWGQRCRTRKGEEKCHKTMDPKYIGPMNGLFDRCEREILSLEPEEYFHEVKADEQGTLLRCLATPWDCVGDCSLDLGIEKVVTGPCPK